MRIKYLVSSAIAVAVIFFAVQTPVFAAHTDFLFLVNGEYGLSPEYAPDEIIAVSDYVPSTKAVIMQKEAGEKLIEMFNAMNAEGIYGLKAVSGFRDFDLQNVLYNNKVRAYERIGSKNPLTEAAMIVAPPGKSEHQTGLAVDVGMSSALVKAFSYTDAGKWLKDNSYKYGYILRYTDEKTAQTGIVFEPWHFRYVGSPHSYIIYRNKWCYEEYIESLTAGELLSIDATNNFVYEVFRSESPDFDMTNVLAWSEDNTGGYVVTRGYYKTDSES